MQPHDSDKLENWVWMNPQLATMEHFEFGNEHIRQISMTVDILTLNSNKEDNRKKNHLEADIIPVTSII